VLTPFTTATRWSQLPAPPSPASPSSDLCCP
jgi:hypothetical protein